MKKMIVAIACLSFLSGCFIFHKQEKYGCPSDPRSIGAEKIASGDPQAIKAASKAKFRH